MGVQPCHPLLEQCGESREGSSQCGLYQLPVVSRQEGVVRCSTVHPAPAGGHHVFRYFRNPHCALCGGVANLSSLSCLASLPSLLSPPCWFLVPPSLSLTLDFSGQGAVGHRWGSTSVHCTVLSGLFTVYSSQCTVHSVQFSVYSSQCTVLSAQFTVHKYSIHLLFSVHFTLSTTSQSLKRTMYLLYLSYLI